MDKIGIYKYRSFGDRFLATLAFLRQYAKSLLVFSIVYMLPVALMGGLIASTSSQVLHAVYDTTNIQDMLQTLQSSSSIGNSMGSLVTILAAPIVFTMFLLYREKNGMLKDLTLGEFNRRFWRPFGKYILFSLVLTGVLILVLIPLIMIVVLCAFIHWSIAVLMGVAVFAVFLAITPIACMLCPVYMLDSRQPDMIETVKISYKYGKATYWGTFGFYIVMSLISYGIGALASLPFTITSTVTELLGGLPMVGFTCNVAGFLITGIAAVIAAIAIVYQYGHAANIVDKIADESVAESTEDNDSEPLS